MRGAFAALGWALLGALLGLGSLAAVTFAIRAPYEERFGPWRGTLLVGRVPENPWQRVAIATRGLVGLPRRPFEPGCAYRFSGPALPARWWSLTPYDADWELIANPDGAYSIGSHNVATGASGRFSIPMNAGAAGPAELPLGDRPGTWVVLRLYHPAPGLAERMDEIEWPRIEREGCS
jgi:hypothetical protein